MHPKTGSSGAMASPPESRATVARSEMTETNCYSSSRPKSPKPISGTGTPFLFWNRMCCATSLKRQATRDRSDPMPCTAQHRRESRIESQRQRVHLIADFLRLHDAVRRQLYVHPAW